MVRITEELVRKKSEHNELMICSLEELSLHQEDIEKIEHIQNWCRNLKILYLQSNLISRIENLHKLKCLEYLNLAVNNIEKIENLQYLESLKKLDLTLNFIGDLRSVENLKNNYNFRQLILTGNPCTDYPNYRNYILAILPQINILDNNDIKLSEQIVAKQNLSKYHMNIIQAEAQYAIKRDEQKIRVHQQMLDLENQMANIDDENERSKLFWESKSENCPETREQIVKKHRKNKKLDEKETINKNNIMKPIQFFAKCGRPYNMNQSKLKFHIIDENDRYELQLYVFKYLDTSFINVDVQPNYIRVQIKKKYFQLALANEVNCNESIIQRSQATGVLLVIMPKLIIKSDQLIVNTIAINSVIGDSSQSKFSCDENKKSELKGTVNYKNIIESTDTNLVSNRPPSLQNSTKLSLKELEEIPPLI